jgi:hypothetical protein
MTDKAIAWGIFDRQTSQYLYSIPEHLVEKDLEDKKHVLEARPLYTRREPIGMEATSGPGEQPAQDSMDQMMKCIASMDRALRDAHTRLHLIGKGCDEKTANWQTGCADIDKCLTQHAAPIIQAIEYERRSGSG